MYVVFGKNAVTQFLTIPEWENYNWLDNYKNSFFKVNVDSSVKSGFILTQN